MNLLGILVVLAGPLLTVAWIFSEFKENRKLRLAFGTSAIVVLTVLTWFGTLVINQFNYNQWYGFATKELIDDTIRGIESNKTAMVVTELKRLQSEYQPSYENRARYVPLVEETVKRMKTANPQ